LCHKTYSVITITYVTETKHKVMFWWSAYVVPLSTPAAIPPQAAAYRRVRRLLPSSSGGVPLGTGAPGS